jgi:PKD domain
MKTLVAITAAGLALLAPSAALGKRTADKTFHSSGAAAAPGAIAGNGEPGTFEDFPFTIAPDDLDGTVTIKVSYLNPADDWDVYVYRKNSTGGLETVGSATDPPGNDSETVAISSQSTPVDPGNYVIRVQNYSATTPNFDGTIKFTDFVIPNAKPVAKLKAPSKATAGRSVKLDGSGSRDSDGSIVNYAWDLNGDGAIETNGGTRKTLSRKFKAGVHHVTLRVTDNEGKRAYATRTIRVSKAKKKKKK